MKQQYDSWVSNFISNVENLLDGSTRRTIKDIEKVARETGPKSDRPEYFIMQMKDQLSLTDHQFAEYVREAYSPNKRINNYTGEPLGIDGAPPQYSRREYLLQHLSDVFADRMVVESNVPILKFNENGQRISPLDRYGQAMEIMKKSLKNS